MTPAHHHPAVGAPFVPMGVVPEAEPVAGGVDCESTLGEREFARLRALVQREAGIQLGPAKRALVLGRLGRRVQELGLRSFGEYCDRAEADAVERVELIDRISTNETHFYREPHHFELLAGTLLPRWRHEAEQGLRPRRIRVWSAACSSGEEPFTLAMVLRRTLPALSGWEVDILASDISTRVLRRAEGATWPADKATEIPDADLKRFMLRGVGVHQGLMRAGPELRECVRFARLNLMEEHPEVGQLDVIFCRNVLIYFDAPTKEAVLQRLARHLAPDGHLFLGHAESLVGTSLPLRAVAPSVYRRDRQGPASG